MVYCINFHGEDEFSGVFSSHEAAKQYINKFSQDDRECFRYEEYALDCELT